MTLVVVRSCPIVVFAFFREQVCRYLAISMALLCLLPALSHANPPNSRLDGSLSGWSCNPGYIRSGSGCRKIGQIKPPAMSEQRGAYWYCKDGYRREGNQCRKVDLPQNSFTRGDQWDCQTGYQRLGTGCVSQDTPITVTAPPVSRSIEEEGCGGGYILVEGVCKMNVPDSPRR